MQHTANVPLRGLLACLLALALTAVAAVPAKAATALEVLNGAQLSPKAAQSEALNGKIQSVLQEITTPEMDTYTKVKACYDYLNDTMTYGAPWEYLDTRIGATTCGDLYFYTGEIEGLAALALEGKTGFCNGYASAFALLCRAIGLDAYVVFGDIRASGGGYTDHKWVEIDVNGATYVFDPQMEQSSVSWTNSRSYFFCTTYESDSTLYRFSHRSSGS